MGRFRRSLTLAGLLFAASLLSGCSQPRLTLSPEELYALPTLPAKYTELNTQLSALLESGAEYAAPTSGANIQSVQLVDLDGDGREEAVAFFRNSSEEKPLKIYIFSADGDSYVQTDLIAAPASTALPTRTWTATAGWSCWWAGRPLRNCRCWRSIPSVPAARSCWCGGST